MKKITTLMTLILFIIIFFNGCNVIRKNVNEVTNMKTTIESTFDISENSNILLSVKSADNNCLELEISNNSSNTIFWGQWYVIEKLDNKSWCQLQEIELEDNVVFGWEDILYSLKGSDITTENENWSDYYGNLPKGNYRIIKSFFYDERKQDENIYVACEFSID